MSRAWTRRTFVGGALAAVASSWWTPSLSPGSPRRRTTPSELEIQFRWNKFLSLNTHLRRLARNPADPPEEYAEAVKVYRHQHFLVPGNDIWFTMESYLARATDLRSVRSQLRLFPLLFRDLDLQPTGQALAAAMENALPAFESGEWPALQTRKTTSVDPALKRQFDPLRKKLLQFLFTSLNAEPIDLRRLTIDLVGRYIQTGYRSLSIKGPYFTIVETERFPGLDLIETCLMMIARIIELEDRGNSKGALFLLRRRQESLHLPNPAVLPRAILYWTAGEAVRRLIDPGHQHVGERLQIYRRAFRPFLPALAEDWNAYLSGQIGLDEALNGIIRKSGGTV
ncbi:MAG: hypothetical protein ACE5IK_05135 [Acidobacteriota bacterium]